MRHPMLHTAPEASRYLLMSFYASLSSFCTSVLLLRIMMLYRFLLVLYLYVLYFGMHMLQLPRADEAIVIDSDMLCSIACYYRHCVQDNLALLLMLKFRILAENMVLLSINLALPSHLLYIGCLCFCVFLQDRSTICCVKCCSGLMILFVVCP